MSRKLNSAVRESEEKYLHVLEHMEEGYYEVDLNGHFTVVNEATCVNLGRTREELIGLNYKQFMLPEDIQRAYEAFSNVYQTGHPVKIFKFTLIQKDGAHKYHEMSISLLRDGSGEPTGFYGISRDRTEQLAMEQALRESEESYRRVMELAPDAITISRLSDGTYYEVNDAFSDHTGYTREETIGRRVGDLNLYADYSDRHRLVSAIQASGRVEGMAIRFRHRDGSVLHDLVSARVIQFKGEQCVLIVATLINDLVEAQQALQESEERYRGILAAAPDAICLTRLADGTYIEANATFYERTGYTPEDTIGNTSLDLGIYQDPLDRRRLTDALVKEGQVDAMEVPFRYKNGRISINLMAARIIQHKGEECVLVVSKEIDELKDYQAALEKSEKFYRSLIDTMPYSVSFARTDDSRYVLVNQAFCERTGYMMEEVVGRTPLELGLYLDSDDRKKIMETIRREGWVDGLEVQYRVRSGEVRDTLLSARVIEFEGQDCLLAISTNVTELKRTQRALLESEAGYRAILDTAPYSVTITRLSDSRYMQVNKGFSLRTGYSEAEVIGRTSLELNIFRDLGERQRLLEAFRRNGHVDLMEVNFQAKDGRLLESIVSARAIQYQGNDCLLVISLDIAPLKAAQRKAAEQEASAQTILKTVPNAITISRSEDGTYLLVNDAFCQNTGYTREEVLGKNAGQLNLYADKADRRAVIEVFRRDGQIDGMQVRFRAKDGSVRESILSIRPIMHQGEACVLAVTSNIDKLKAIQDALTQSEAGYRTILETAPYTIVITRSSDNRYVEVNNAFCRRTGYAREEAIGRTPFDLNLYMNPDDRKAMQRALRRDGQVEGFEVEFRGKDGRILESMISVRPILYKGEDCILTMTVDIGELKRTQRMLEESQASYRKVIESAPNSMSIVRKSDGVYVDVNTAFTTQFGYRLEEVLGKTPLDLNLYVAPADREQYLEILRTQQRVSGFEIQLQRKDQSIMDCLTSIIPITYRGEACYLSSTIDISDMKAAQKALEHHQQHLEEMVAERTRELKEAQNELIKREKLSVLGQLTATVSHELRNPLGVIRSSNFYLQRKIKDPDQKVDKHFRRIEEQVSLCDAIVGDLLEFTRGRNVSMVTEDITPWLQAVIEQMRESEGIHIAWDLAAKLPAVPHDLEKMRRVVINVLDNAIQAVNAKRDLFQKRDAVFEPRVTVRTDFDADAITIEIADNGLGMNAETRQRAFEPLFTTRSRGTGIGLANVRKIVQEHHGKVDLRSRAGEGTRLTIRLPRVENKAMSE